MRAVMRGSMLLGGLLCSLGATAGDFYAHPPDGRNVIWPPPGGLSQSQPPMAPAWDNPAKDAFGSYGDAPSWPSYYPGYRHPGNRVPPPGWPPAAARANPPAPPPRPAPLERGHPVEVVPPPGIPVDEVKQAISDKPQRGWRPVPREAGAAARYPAAQEKREPVLREPGRRYFPEDPPAPSR